MEDIIDDHLPSKSYDQPPSNFDDQPLSKSDPMQSKNCMRCGKGQHSWHSCPARDATCHRCQRKGHYSSQC